MEFHLQLEPLVSLNYRRNHETPLYSVWCISDFGRHLYAAHSLLCSHSCWPCLDHILMIRLQNVNFLSLLLDSRLTRLVSAQATPENVVPKSMPTHNLRSFSERPAKVETMVRSADSNQSLEIVMRERFLVSRLLFLLEL
jgi:hypothetical protein